MAKIKKNTHKNTYKMIISGILAALVVVLILIAACFIVYGLGRAPEPIENLIIYMEDELSGAGITIPFIGTTKQAIEEQEQKHEPITTPYIRPGTTSEGALDEEGKPIGTTKGAVGTTEGALSTSEGAIEEEVDNGLDNWDGDVTKLYPKMKGAYPGTAISYTNTVFLTFDDGPCSVTEDILDILAEHDIRATFFVVGNRLTDATKPIIDRMVNDGHTIGVHTTCHKYKTIYASVENYLADFNTTYELIYKMTGKHPTIFRFPGGSINAYNSQTHTAIVNEMSRRGFVYYDWNVSAGDASNNPTEELILTNATRGLKYQDKQKNVIVLMHDTSSLTASQLEAIIETYEEAGFTFKALNPEVKPIIF